MADSMRFAAADRLLEAERELRAAQEQLRANPHDDGLRDRYAKAVAEEKAASAWAEAITTSPADPS